VAIDVGHLCVEFHLSCSLVDVEFLEIGKYGGVGHRWLCLFGWRSFMVSAALSVCVGVVLLCWC
jgi:hypothetical protein